MGRGTAGVEVQREDTVCGVKGGGCTEEGAVLPRFHIRRAWGEGRWGGREVGRTSRDQVEATLGVEAM